MANEKDYSEDSNNFYINEQNKKKKKELEEKYGMISFNGSSEAPPEVMNNFLRYVQQFEENYVKAETKKIREILGNPKFKKLEKIDSQNIENEIELVLKIYAACNFIVDIIEKEEVSPEDFYSFLTHELPEHETNFINVPGMNTNFIYEEFHPNPKLNIKDCIEYFNWGLKVKDKEQTLLWSAKDKIILNNIPYDRDHFAQNLFKFFPDKISESKINFKEINIKDLNADIELIISYNKNDSFKTEIYNMMFEFNKVDAEYMEVKSLYIKSIKDNI